MASSQSENEEDANLIEHTSSQSEQEKERSNIMDSSIVEEGIKKVPSPKSKSSSKKVAGSNLKLPIDIYIENEDDEIENQNKSVEIVSEVPSYETDFTGYLTEKEFCMDTGKHIANDARPKKVCFNCLGDHNINDCKETKNFQAIAKNRKTILGKRVNYIRYHEDAENKFANFGSGISESLRFALGLHGTEAPEFIYKMRVLGYPPGWLKEAEVRRSDVSLFDGNGIAMTHPDEEEGETDVALVKYNPEKLISFPGFNVPFPSDIRDQYREFNYPKMKPHHRKEEFEKFMKLNKASKYKRKKLKSSDTPCHDSPSKTTKEMDVDDSQMDKSAKIEFNPPLPPEVPAPPPPPSSPPASFVKEDGEISEDSNDECSPEPSLKKLKTALPESLSSSPSPSPLNTTIDLDATIPIADNELNTTKDDKNLPSEMSSNTTSVMVKKIHHHRSGSKGFTLGVSIPTSITPFKKLPDWEKWTNEVSEHILFENLPDALGTWKKMKGIMQNVKSNMQKLHLEEENDEDE